jgi:nicotinamidase-related amidase
MAIDLDDLVAPRHTALVTVEVQDGVVGEHSVVPELARAAEPILPRIAALAGAARTAGARVVHCTAEARGDGQGSNHNTPLLATMAKRVGSRGGGLRHATVHETIGASDTDLVLGRVHGLSPMTSTSLDPVLRNLGVTTIVATGVSVNVAVLGFAFEAVNLGYRLVVPRDAVAGVDDAYVDAVFARTLRLLATITTCDDVISAWGAAR